MHWRQDQIARLRRCLRGCHGDSRPSGTSEEPRKASPLPPRHLEPVLLMLDDCEETLRQAPTMPNAQDDQVSMGSSFQEQSPYHTSPASVVSRATMCHVSPPSQNRQLNVRKSLHQAAVQDLARYGHLNRSMHCCSLSTPWQTQGFVTQCCQLAALVLRVQLASADLPRQPCELKATLRSKPPALASQRSHRPQMCFSSTPRAVLCIRNHRLGQHASFTIKVANLSDQASRAAMSQSRRLPRMRSPLEPKAPLNCFSVAYDQTKALGRMGHGL